MEKVIDCPVCFDSDRCFEDMQEKFNSYMCFNCGFMSNSVYTDDNLDKIENSSKLVNELKFYDEGRKIYWYPSVVNMGQKGIIFPEGSPDNWIWKYAEVVPIKEEEQLDYPIPGEDDKYYTEKLDVEGAKTYGQYEFLHACKEMGITMEVPNV
jgi:hypothetical protein